LRDSAELWAWLAISHISGIGPARFHQLRSFNEPFASWFNAQTLNALGRARICQVVKTPMLDQNAIGLDWDWAQQPGQALISYLDPRYPAYLKEISTPPPLLYVKGAVETLHMPAIGIVGSRVPTPEGRGHAYRFARELTEHGYCIVSGLAKGIDTAAHAGACAKNGRTIAVLGHGLDTIYPIENTGLAQSILRNGGALLSEFPIGVGPMRAHFPRRNRIISGLSFGVLVVEAAEKSGSLITAHYAMEQGREVFALPGAIGVLQSQGCHQLIREGATLIENIAQIQEALHWAIR